MRACERRFGAIIRADNTPIVIAEESNIQDGSVCHSDDDCLVVGAPARMMRQVTDEERRLLRASAAHYPEKAARYAAGLTHVDARSGRQ